MGKATGDREFARRLRALMDERDMTQAYLAAKADVQPSRVSGWACEREGITLHNLRRVRSVLGCTWDELLGE